MRDHRGRATLVRNAMLVAVATCLTAHALAAAPAARPRAAARATPRRVGRPTAATPAHRPTAPVTAADRRSSAVRWLAFANGPTVLLAPDSLAGAVNVGVWYDAGSRNDPEGRSGLALVLARSALAPPADVQQRLGRLGATFASSVTADMTVESITMPTELLADGLGAAASRVMAPALADTSLASGVARVREARSRRMAASPLLPVIERLQSALYVGHGYATPASGREEDLTRITLEDARADLARRFTPTHALISVVGRFDPAEAQSVLRERFGAPSSGAITPPAAVASMVWPRPRPRLDTRPSMVPFPIVLVGWRGLPDRDPDAPALEVLTELLTGGDRPLLLRELAGPGHRFFQVQGSYERRRDASAFIVAGALPAVTDSIRAETELAHAVERWSRNAIGPDQLATAQRRVEASMLERAQTAEGRAEGLASAWLMDSDSRAWERRIQSVRAVTVADVRRVAARVLDPRFRSIVWAGPLAGGRQ